MIGPTPMISRSLPRSLRHGSSRFDTRHAISKQIAGRGGRLIIHPSPGAGHNRPAISRAETGDYQTTQLSSGFIAVPSLQEKTLEKSALFASGPMTRN